MKKFIATVVLALLATSANAYEIKDVNNDCRTLRDELTVLHDFNALERETRQYDAGRFNLLHHQLEPFLVADLVRKFEHVAITRGNYAYLDEQRKFVAIICFSDDVGKIASAPFEEVLDLHRNNQALQEQEHSNNKEQILRLIK
jgi:hypothetical protein